jgi:hypothetical protein
MRFKTIASFLVFLSSYSVVRSAPEDHSVVTYYDRNNDGVVDYELHQVPGTMYWAWALIDSKFIGRYDRRIKLAYPFDSETVNLPVPRHVKITKGGPPNITDHRLDAPTPSR